MVQMEVDGPLAQPQAYPCRLSQEFMTCPLREKLYFISTIKHYPKNMIVIYLMVSKDPVQPLPFKEE
jgi:hypothetical protein